MHAAGRGRPQILRLWAVVAAVCVIASAIGFGIADSVSGELRAGINGFAAGALLVMLIDSMIPDARKDTGRAAGLVTVLGIRRRDGPVGSALGRDRLAQVRGRPLGRIDVDVDAGAELEARRGSSAAESRSRCQ